MWTDEALPRLRERGLGRAIGAAARCAWPGSANHRSPTCSARRSCGPPTRSSRRTPERTRSMSGSRRAGRAPTARHPRRGSRRWPTRVAATLAGARLGRGRDDLAGGDRGRAGRARPGSSRSSRSPPAAALAALLGDRDWLTFSEALGAGTATARSHGTNDGLEHLARRGPSSARHARGRVRARAAWRGHGGVGRRGRAGLGPSRAADGVPRRRERPDPGGARRGPHRC